ncbi:MAG: hypothetical protein CME06_15835 [Gemmatimonadetes bacterium]|nr:hypothetical protein [Gemmatimonadota bacterium]
MPFHDPDPTDPMSLVGVQVDVGRDSMTDMAWAFAEEFAGMGHDAESIMALFRRPHYAGAHGAYKVLGDTEVLRIVEECVQALGRVHFVVRDAQPLGSRRSESGAEKE